MSKVFDENHYDEDDWAKFKVLNWLRQNKFDAEVNPDKYGIDLLACRNGVRSAYEVEVKHNWGAYDFPFSTVHFSGRKKKFLTDDLEVWFVMLNYDHTNALFVGCDDFLNGREVWKDTKFSQMEPFVEIDVSLARFVDLERIYWE